ncbi:YgaP-like transmembrane domain [Leptospira idonii]|uniref:DUF2892 domain-containing protein n=1 Tax=Leptospira idonii TaxID=1193500 RepID=A0A4R9M4G1_9LEPT|nr:YgaP-like transmembrane domain [Leptospira idonii]TGN20735.1 DUF2892 domain-containing protein [Leptospira idonii]
MYIASTKVWHLERVLFLIAGAIGLIGLGLGLYLSQWWFLLNLLVGFNLILFSFTGFCPMAVILAKLGFEPKK